jgi:hypothetical protein
MEFQAYEGKKEKLPAQNLSKIIRQKFILVEWGGAEIGNNKVE